ncbi:hypothetical protein [Spirosoma rhododendri]|uniref:Uncharacterized protein n=1 Tax=Spirosoma rhododendri TaxID=2728024 RepID=A0A7L5DIM3_9BACT|nr:hypothetical protein [Spirosoma rhododendri]QJD78234.1 hypothetical protein HH216_07195 [Spirosoma rhododendri]
MNTNEIASPRFTPGSVPVAEQVKIYYSADINAAGGIDAFMKQIGSDQPKSLPALTFSVEEWDQMLDFIH